MSEPQADYVTDALEMMGQGYDQPAAIIDPPRTVTALRDKGLIEYKVWGWVKMSAKFIAHIGRLKGAKLAVWSVIALTISENGKCDLSVSEIAKLAGYSTSETRTTISELGEIGYMSIESKSGKRNIYSPEFVARAAKTPTDRPLQETCTPPVGESKCADDPYSPPIGNSVPSYKELKELKEKKLFSFTQKEKDQVNEQVDYMLFNNDPSKAWQGREMIRADLLEYADWYHGATGQAMRSKPTQSSWWKALDNWKAEDLTIQDLQSAYDARSKWRTVADPNELTKDAAAIHALPHAVESYDPSRPREFGL